MDEGNENEIVCTIPADFNSELREECLWLKSVL